MSHYPHNTHSSLPAGFIRKATKILVLELSKLRQPVITSYQLGVLFFTQNSLQALPNKTAWRRASLIANTAFKQVKENLLEIPVLTRNKQFPPDSVFNLISKAEAGPEEIVCTVDPFAYVSHLSAMAYHGLTNRIPKTLFITTPPSPMWREYAERKMERDLTARLRQYLDFELPALQEIEYEKVQKHPVNKHRSKHQGAFKAIRGKELRVATVGRTFLDMLRQPDLCGGIHHVIEVYRGNARSYQPLILDTIHRHGTLIEKARAGYILETMCEIKDPVIDQWAQTVQRGGSRKLDPHADYSPNYSERWSLSLNLT